jgi:polysaccharide deacetylase 2 family uncharacterized protein YibQ
MPDATADAAPDPVADKASPDATALVEPDDLPPMIVADAPEPPIGVADAPQPGFKPVPGVKVNRLPTIGSPPPAAEPAAEADAGAETATELPQLAPDGGATTAIARYGAEFANPDNLPLLAVLIIDKGEAAGGLDSETLATIAFPVTIAIDPTQPDAATRAAAYRAAGFEVAILAQSLPPRATASDLEVMYQAYREVLPEAALFMGTQNAPFQKNRQAADHLVAMLKPDGMGLVTFGRGLNPSVGLANEAGLPHAEIYRSIDAEGERSEAIRRALDRAAFEATQNGQAVVLAQSLPETITALFGWAAEGAKGVAVAPVSAVAVKAVGR